MLASGLSALLAGAATVAQLATIVVVLRLAWRHVPRPVSIGLMVALVLMAFRRALWRLQHADLAAGPAYAIAHEGIGLAVSLVFLAAALFTERWLRRRPLAPPDSGPPSATAPTVAPEVWDDRELLCYDLHDGLGQLVFGARMHLDAYCAAQETGDAAAQRELDLARDRLNEAAAEVTRVVSWLKLSFASDTSLSQAIKQYLTELAQSEGWQTEFEDQLGGRRLEPVTEAMAYRVVQEALNNAARHGRTPRVRVALAAEGSALVATVQDWGRGFDLREALCEGHGLGLRGMHRRAQRIGGVCAVESRPGEGATVVLRVPGALAEAQVP